MVSLNEIQKINMNIELLSSFSELKNIQSQITNLLLKATKNKDFFTQKYSINSNSVPYKYGLIDFECNPPKIFGCLVGNQIYQIYIKSEEHILKFNIIVVKLLSILQELYLFCFSNHENRFIKKILPYKLTKLKQNLSTQFLINLKIVNIQLRNNEGLIPALFSIGESPYDDPLLRNNDNLDIHYMKGHYNLILEHNKSCLLSTLKLLKIRYLKSHL